jgi:hypothetical protein
MVVLKDHQSSTAKVAEQEEETVILTPAGQRVERKSRIMKWRIRFAGNKI